MSTHVVTLPGTATDSALPLLERDEVIVPGVLWCVDINRIYSWAGGSPVNGSVVNDLTRNNNHGSVVIAGGSISLAGGGFDFSSGVDGSGAFIKRPTGTLSPLFTAQQFLSCDYFKFPSSANWSNSTSNPSSFSKIFKCNSGNSFAGASVPDLFYLAQLHSGANPTFNVQRQTNGVTAVNLGTAVGDLANFFGQVVQIGVWRSSTEFAFRLKSALGTLTKTTSVGALNTQDAGTTYGSIGICENTVRLSGSERNGLRWYRGWIENLVTTGRTPLTVLDADWTRTVARAVFS